MAKCAGQSSGLPSGARLDDLVILVTLKFAEQHSVQLRWSRQSQSTASPRRGGAGRREQNHRETSLRAPSAHLSVKLLSKALTKPALGPHHGVFLTEKLVWGFPCGSALKNPPARPGDTGLIPVLGRPLKPQSS